MTFEETNKILTDTIKELVIPTVETGLSEISVIYMLEEELRKKGFPFGNRRLMKEMIPLARTCVNLFDEESKKGSDTQILYKRCSKLYEHAILLMESKSK